MAATIPIERAELYEQIKATVGTDAHVRVPLNGEDYIRVRARLSSYLAYYGYRLRVRREGDALYCRAERRSA